MQLNLIFLKGQPGAAYLIVKRLLVIQKFMGKWPSAPSGTSVSTFLMALWARALVSDHTE